MLSHGGEHKTFKDHPHHQHPDLSTDPVQAAGTVNPLFEQTVVSPSKFPWSSHSFSNTRSLSKNRQLLWLSDSICNTQSIFEKNPSDCSHLTTLADFALPFNYCCKWSHLIPYDSQSLPMAVPLTKLELFSRNRLQAYISSWWTRTRSHRAGRRQQCGDLHVERCGTLQYVQRDYISVFPRLPWQVSHHTHILTERR